MASPPSKLVKKHMKFYQAALKKVKATIIAKGDGGYPAQAAEINASHAAWTPIP